MFEVLPALNCLDADSAENRLRVAKSFLPLGGWLHLDVADARFTHNKTWGDPDAFAHITENDSALQFEVHLMVEEPWLVAERWFDAGAKRLVIHLEALQNFRMVADHARTVNNLLEIAEECRGELTLAINPETPVEELIPYGEKFSWFQILAVNPGFAGQKFLPLTIHKLRALRARLPNAKIELDGGVTPEIVRKIKEIGIQAVVSASYIFDNADPKSAYASLYRA